MLGPLPPGLGLGGPGQPFVALRAGPGRARAPKKPILMMRMNSIGSENDFYIKNKSHHKTENNKGKTRKNNTHAHKHKQIHARDGTHARTHARTHPHTQTHARKHTQKPRMQARSLSKKMYAKVVATNLHNRFSHSDLCGYELQTKAAAIQHPFVRK